MIPGGSILCSNFAMLLVRTPIDARRELADRARAAAHCGRRRRQSVGVSGFPARGAAAIVDGVPGYLVESYLPRTRAAEFERATSRARKAAEAMRGEGIAVRYVRSTFLLEDEVCLHFFKAPSLQVALEMSKRAEIACNRIAEAVESRVAAERRST